MRKTSFIIGALMFMLTIYQIAGAYAKYVTQATGTVDQQAGAWVITLNDDDITGGSVSQTFDIDNLTYPANAYVAANKIAPGSTGCFDIEIDPTGTSVAVRFDVTVDTSALAVSSAITMSSACTVVNNVENPNGMTRTGANTYTGVISLASIQSSQTTTARFYITWTNSESNNASDSALGTTANNDLAIPVNVVVSQYGGETITAYSGN